MDEKIFRKKTNSINQGSRIVIMFNDGTDISFIKPNNWSYYNFLDTFYIPLPGTNSVFKVNCKNIIAVFERN